MNTDTKNFELRTPGDWGVEKTGTCYWVGPMRRPPSLKVAAIVSAFNFEGYKDETVAEMKANALLTAAAPTLLKQRDALKEALITCEDALCRLGQMTDETRIGGAIQAASKALAFCEKEDA